MVKKGISNENPPSVSGPRSPVDYLNRAQVQRLTQSFETWKDSAPNSYIRRVRGRYWLVYLYLRFTGARLGEILRIDDSTDIDYRLHQIKVTIEGPSSIKKVLRMIPVPEDLILQVIEYLSEFPGMRGNVFALDQGNFRREFYKRAEEADIPRHLSHPHILRHTRAIEMIEAGVPLTMVQDLLGHSLLSTTTVYLQKTEITSIIILKQKGLL